MLKVIGSLFVVISSGLMGLKLSNDYIGRIIRLNDFKKMMKVLKNEITYNNESILEAIKKTANTNDQVINDFLLEVIHIYEVENLSLNDSWIKATDNTLKESNIAKPDLELISQIGNNLGITCKATQIDYIENFIFKIDLIEEELQSKKEEKCKLYKSMGVMTGLLIVILFI